METYEQLKNYTDNIAHHLNVALQCALHMQGLVASTEGDSDLHRKLAYYLIPNLNQWINGVQAGNVRDLHELLARREAAGQVTASKPVKEGDGHAVLTAPIKE